MCCGPPTCHDLARNPWCVRGSGSVFVVVGARAVPRAGWLGMGTSWLDLRCQRVQAVRVSCFHTPQLIGPKVARVYAALGKKQSDHSVLAPSFNTMCGASVRRCAGSGGGGVV